MWATHCMQAGIDSGHEYVPPSPAQDLLNFDFMGALLDAKIEQPDLRSEAGNQDANGPVLILNLEGLRFSA